MATTSQRLTALETKVAALETWKAQQINHNRLQESTDTGLDARLDALESEPAPEPEPVPEPTPTPTTNPSGQAMPTSEPAGWRRIFQDDFNRTVPEGSFPGRPTEKDGWTAYPIGWQDTSRNGWYDPSIISVHDSVLDMFVRQKDGKWRVAGPEIVAARNVTSGRLAFAFKADPVPGFKTAWLWWPTSNVWPRDGEIDFPEGNLSSIIEGYMHRQGATVGSDQDYRTSGKPFTSWHIGVVEWEAGKSCSFYLDGVLLAPTMTSRVPNTPMRWVFQTETRLSGGVPPAGAQGHVLIDWVTFAVKS